MQVKTITRDAIVTALSLMFAALVSISAWAVDGVAVEAGRADRSDMARAALQWRWSARWLQGDAWHVGGYWDLSVAQWEREGAPGSRTRLAEIGLTPVFRLQANDLRGAYLEGGIGAHWLSATELGDKRFGSRFQFGEHAGFGYRFGTGGEIDLSYRYQHLSNADLREPNDGVNFHQLRLQYWFR